MAYKLVWCDLFENDGKPNPEIWNIETGGSGFGNKECQFYTDRLDNVYVKDSHLHIVARKEKYEHLEYTSGKITTANKKHIKYGKVEMCAKIPSALGTWSAFWMLGANVRKGYGWPRCGEIDIMEHVGKRPLDVWFSLHSETNNHKINTQITRIHQIDNILEGFHTYSITWKEDEISFYVDDILYETFTNNDPGNESIWPFNNHFFMIINLAIGGNLGGAIDDSKFPLELVVKHVKVYEEITILKSSNKND